MLDISDFLQLFQGFLQIFTGHASECGRLCISKPKCRNSHKETRQQDPTNEKYSGVLFAN